MNYNILWIEDDSYKIIELVLPLETDGCNVDIMESSNQVMSNIDNVYTYDLIILDLRIPEGIEHKNGNIKEYAGVDLLFKIRKKYPKKPIIVLSVVSDLEILEKVQRANIKKIITKGSCLPSKLKNDVYEALSGH